MARMGFSQGRGGTSIMSEMPAEAGCGMVTGGTHTITGCESTRNVPAGAARHSVYWSGRPGDVLLRSAGDAAERGRQNAQAEGPMHSQHPESWRGPTRWRALHA